MSSGIITAARLVVFMNGRVFGECTGFEWDGQSPVSEKRGVDSVTAYELSTDKVGVTGTVSALRIRATGGLEGRGIVAPSNYLHKERYFSILIVDRVDGTRIFRADRCRVSGQRWRVAAKGRMEGSFSFLGIEWSNEAGESYLGL